MTTSEQRESDAGEAAAKYAKLYHDCRAQLAAAERERDALAKFAALQDAWELEAMGDITALFKERNELRTRAERAEARHDAERKVIEAAVAWEAQHTLVRNHKYSVIASHVLYDKEQSMIAAVRALATGHQGGA